MFESFLMLMIGPSAAPCLRCHGTGMVPGILDGDKPRRCSRCPDASGLFQVPDLPAILMSLTTIRGATPGKRRFRASCPREVRDNDPRAYYVWRMARFHGGQDVTMPVWAGIVTVGDPFLDVLDRAAEALAKIVFGTNNAAALRWYNALGGNLPVPDDMPASAHSGGPVVLDNNKIAEEDLEMK